MSQDHSSLPPTRGEGAGQPLNIVLAEIEAERRRQVSVEGWTAEHDDEHDLGQLARAAACYAASNNRLSVSGPSRGPERVSWSKIWPWEPEWWKPQDRRRNLIKAGALIVAEIERLDRAAQPHPPGGHSHEG